MLTKHCSLPLRITLRSKSRSEKAVLLALGRVCGKTWDRPEFHSHKDDATWSDWRDFVLYRMLQLVIFVCAMETLSERSGQQIKAFAQDPSFEATDEEFLQSLGIEVLRVPAAESITDHETIVYAPCMIYPHTANTLTRCIKHQPAIYAGHDVDWVANAVATFPESFSKLKESKDDTIDRLRAYEKERTIIDVWPRSEYYSTIMEMHALTGTFVHIRKTMPTDEELKQACTPHCEFTVFDGLEGATNAIKSEPAN